MYALGDPVGTRCNCNATAVIYARAVARDINKGTVEVSEFMKRKSTFNINCIVLYNILFLNYIKCVQHPSDYFILFINLLIFCLQLYQVKKISKCIIICREKKMREKIMWAYI